MKVCSGKKMPRFKFQYKIGFILCFNIYPFKCCVKEVTTQVLEERTH